MAKAKGSKPTTSSGRLNDSLTSTRIVLPSSRVTVRLGNRCLFNSCALGTSPTSIGSKSVSFGSLNAPRRPKALKTSGPMVQRLPTVDFGLLNWRPQPSAGIFARRFAVSASGFHFSSSPFDRRITPCTACGCPETTSQSPTIA